MKRFWLLLFFSSLLFGNLSPQLTSLDGNWSYFIEHHPRPYGATYQFKGDEPKMTLPNNWYLNGINHAGVVWYETTIYSNALPCLPFHFLNFEGVDYMCDVWINEQYIGSHTGYFQTFSMDISKALKNGENRIKVRVNSPLENFPTHYSLHKVLLRGIFSHHDTRPGGAWSEFGQDKNSGGIWNHISIGSYFSHKFDALKVTPTVQKEGVLVDISLSLQRLFASSSKQFEYIDENPYQQREWRITFVPSNFKGISYIAKMHVQKGQTQHFRLFLPDAKLWSTHDRGFPHLYTMTLELGDTQMTQKVGFKTVTLNANEQFILNDTPLYLKGTNYISTQYLSQMDETKFRQDLQLMKEAHINTIRVHAHIEPKMFYDLCDEMGFLVWQDYNLQWGYIDEPNFQKEAIRQAQEMVDHLYNHPSIMLWSIHNEPPYDSDWMRWKYPDYSSHQNKALDDAIFEKIKTYDTYHLSKKLSSNNEHPWFGWYSGNYRDFDKKSRAKIVTEYGAQAVPSMESLTKIFPKKYLNPNSDNAKKEWEYHNFQFDWNAKNGITYKGDLLTFIKESQEYQANLIKYATEMLRIQKYDGTTGIFQFMFNEGWPSINWGAVDYYRKKKLGYEALKNAFAPLIVVARQTPEDRVEFYVVNDTLDLYSKALFEVCVTKENGQEPEDRLVSQITIPKDSVKKIGEMIVESPALFSLTLKTSEGEITNFYHFTPNRKVK